jgi:glyoxylase-like metal-dependent hydrolase (beta-lactamase superfamily II)
MTSSGVIVSTEPFFDTRRIGEARITVISEGMLPWAPRLQAPEAEWRAAVPHADADGVVPLGLNLVLIHLGDAAILVDPGFEDPSDSPAETWPGLVRSPGLHAALQAMKVKPEQITHVLITHTHSDHYAGVTVERKGERVPRYPNARYLVGRADWEQNPQRAKPDSTLAIQLGTLAGMNVLELVDNSHEVVPGVTMLAAPGESPGHCVVHVRSGSEVFYYLGDLFHLGCEVAHPDWLSAGRDPEAMLASRLRVMADAAAARATVVFAHEPFPGWGQIVAVDPGYRWEPSKVLSHG